MAYGAYAFVDVRNGLRTVDISLLLRMLGRKYVYHVSMTRKAVSSHDV